MWRHSVTVQLNVKRCTDLRNKDTNQRQERGKTIHQCILIQSASVISKHKESDLFRQPSTALSDGTSMATRGLIMPWLLVST